MDFRFVERKEELQMKYKGTLIVVKDIEKSKQYYVDLFGQKVIRFYDLDGNLIEVGTPV